MGRTAARPRATRSDEDDLVAALRVGNRRIQELLRRAVRPFDLTETEYRALARIDDGEADRPSRVAESLGVTPAATTALLDRLAARGLLARRPNPADRRSTLLALSPRGRALRNRARGSYRALVHRVAVRLGPRGQRRLIGALEEFGRAVARVAEEPSG